MRNFKSNPFRASDSRMVKLHQIKTQQALDKNLLHSYLPVYERLLQHRKYTAESLLEIGVHDGASMQLWHTYLPAAQISGVDIDPLLQGHKDILQACPRLTLFMGTDAYQERFITGNLTPPYDVLIDDGPHTQTSFEEFIRLYLPLLKDDGIAIIEDVKSVQMARELLPLLSQEDQAFAEIYDLTALKQRSDDVLLVIDRSSNPLLRLPVPDSTVPGGVGTRYSIRPAILWRATPLR